MQRLSTKINSKKKAGTKNPALLFLVKQTTSYQAFPELYIQIIHQFHL